MSLAPQKKIELYSPQYFAACALGGVISCGVTHGLMTPLDLVKCNAQTNPTVFPGALAGIRVIYSGRATHLGFGQGLSGLAKGWAPTFVGYGIQGLCKFGFYEYFKHYYGSFFSAADEKKYKDFIWASASASAELIADVGLCPFEAVKVRVQTSPEFAKGLMDGLPKMIAEGGIGTLYAGLVPLWARQVPYTVIKFVAFERIAEMIYARLPKKKEDMTKTEQMGVVFAAGYLAGILCGIVSHPADTMVSKINKMKTSGSAGEKMKLIYNGAPEKGVVGQPGYTPAVKGIGFGGLWAGLGPRVVMIGTLTGLQWFAYGAFKTAVGLPAPGGK